MPIVNPQSNAAPQAELYPFYTTFLTDNLPIAEDSHLSRAKYFNSFISTGSTRYIYKLETKKERISRLIITKKDYKQDEPKMMPFTIKLPDIDFDVEYIKAVDSAMAFFVKLK